MEDEIFSMGLPESQMVDSAQALEDFGVQDDQQEEDAFGLSELEDTVAQEGKKASRNSDDYITDVLAKKGIDRENVRFVDDNGDEYTVPFDELSDEEKRFLLNQEDHGNELSDEEIKMINYLRGNGISVQEFIEWQRRQAVEDYTNNNNQIQYTVDDISDEELLRFDLTEKYPTLDEDEIEQQMQLEMQNPTMFAKKVAALREEYKQLEANQIAQQKEEEEQSRMMEEEEIVRSLVGTAQNTSYMYGFELDNNDKNDVLNFLLNKDVNGRSEFTKLMQDPQALFTLAWFALKGGDAFKATNDYWQKQIAESRRADKPASKVVRKTSAKADDDKYGLNKYFNS